MARAAQGRVPQQYRLRRLLGGIEQTNSFCQSGQGYQLGLLADLTPEQRLELAPAMATFASVRHRALLSPLFATIWRPPAQQL